MLKSSNDARAFSAAPLNKRWQLLKQACVTLASQPHSAERTSCWWLWCTGVSTEPNFTLAWPMALARQRPAAPSKRLKMCWSNPNNFTCQAKKVATKQHNLWNCAGGCGLTDDWTSKNKTKTALQRQKEAAYTKSAVDGRFEYRANPGHQFLSRKLPWLSVVQTKLFPRRITHLYFSRCRLSRLD